MNCYYCGVNPRTDREACTECAGRWKKPECEVIALPADALITICGIPITGGFLDDCMPDVPMQAGQTWKNPVGVQQKVREVLESYRYDRFALMYPSNGKSYAKDEWHTVALTPDGVPGEGWTLIS